MSKLYTQDWEAAPSAPWGMSGLYISRSATGGPLDGTLDARIATTAGSGIWQFSPTPPAGRGGGRARLHRIQASFKLRLGVVPSGINFPVIFTSGPQLEIVDVGDADATKRSKLRLGSNIDFGATIGGTALVINTTYQIDIDWRWERDTGVYLRCWRDGALLITHRDDDGSAAAGGFWSVISGGLGGSKGTVTCNWGDVRMWVGHDPQ